MRIESIGFRDFPPFANGLIRFRPSEADGLAETQILTGQNGTGKTRLLCALAAALGNPTELDQRHVAQSTHSMVALISFGTGCAIFQRRGQTYAFDRAVSSDFLNIILDGGLPTHEWLSRLSTSVPNIQVEQNLNSVIEFAQSKTPCSAQAYRGTSRIVDQKIAAMQSVKWPNARDELLFDRPKSEDTMICQSMANLRMVAAMEGQSELPPGECRAIETTRRFEAAISAVTGRTFALLVRPQPEVHLTVRWGGVEMKLVELPDGLRSIIAWLVACISTLETRYPEHPSPLDIPVILLLDEPESHLHPAWQRRLLPAAQRLFPNAQIFVATHSPFVISSVNSGWIHVLRANQDGQVTVDEPKPCSKGDTWIDAVEDVLGLTSWYDPETEALLAEFRTLKREVLSERGDISSLKEKADAIASRSESLRSMMAREMHQLQRNMAEAVAEP